MKHFQFINNPNFSNSSDLLIVNIPTIRDKEHLLKVLCAELNFPDYFGQNWDALWDCITDLGWIDEKDIILVHNSLPKLDSHDLEIYLRILDEAITFWSESDGHSFEVIFPKKVEIELKDIII